MEVYASHAQNIITKILKVNCPAKNVQQGKD